MYPVLFHIGTFALFSHGVLAAVGFMVAVWWFLRVAHKRHLHLEFFADHFFSFIVWGLIGARLGYLFCFSSRYTQNPLSMLYIWDGGFLLWSGLVFFLLTLFYHCYRQKEKIGQWLDVIVPAGIIGFAFETFGAFLGGGHYGKPTELPWGVSFQNAEVPYTIPIHPVQLYLLAAILLLLVLIHIMHRRHLKESFVGLISLCLFALFSFFTEYFRGDEMLLLFNHRFTQILQLMVFLFSLGLIFVNKRKQQF